MVTAIKTNICWVSKCNKANIHISSLKEHRHSFQKTVQRENQLSAGSWITWSRRGRGASLWRQAGPVYWNRNRSEEQIRRAKTPWKALGPPAGSTETFPVPGVHTPPPPGKTKKQFVIESLHLGFDNKRNVNYIVTRQARIIHMTSATPQEERRYIKVQSDKGRAQVQQWQISSLPGRRHKYLTSQGPFPQTAGLELFPGAPSQPEGWGDTWLWVMPAPHTPLPSLSHSSVVFSAATAESLHTSDTEMSHTILKKK